MSLHSKEGKSHKIMRKYILERCSGAGLRSTLRPTEVMATEGMPRTLSRFMVNIPWMEISPNLNGFPQRCLRHKKQFFLTSSWNCAYDSTFSLSITEQCLPSNPLLNRNSNTYLPLFSQWNNPCSSRIAWALLAPSPQGCPLQLISTLNKPSP